MRTCLSDGFNFFLNLSPNSSFCLILLIFSWFEMQPCTHSSSGISRPKKRDPKNVADPPMLPHKSEMQKKMRSEVASQAWKTLCEGVYNYLGTPRYLVPYTTPSSH